jgi:hypothetical protein
MLESSHLIDEIESVAPEVANKYTNLIDDMEEKVDTLWCLMLDLQSTMKDLEKKYGQEVHTDYIYRTIKATLDFLTIKTRWQHFNEIDEA